MKPAHRLNAKMLTCCIGPNGQLGRKSVVNGELGVIIGAITVNLLIISLE
jgi:hypothetical protein